VRKKIPTITRPDPAYAASLRPEEEEDPGKEEVLRAETIREFAPAPPPRQVAAVAAAAAATASPTRTRRSPATRKIDIRVNALERQEEALIDCGVDPAHVIRAALRRAEAALQVLPHAVAGDEAELLAEWQRFVAVA